MWKGTTSYSIPGLSCLVFLYLYAEVSSLIIIMNTPLNYDTSVTAWFLAHYHYSSLLISTPASFDFANANDFPYVVFSTRLRSYIAHLLKKLPNTHFPHDFHEVLTSFILYPHSTVLHLCYVDFIFHSKILLKNYYVTRIVPLCFINVLIVFRIHYNVYSIVF